MIESFIVFGLENMDWPAGGDSEQQSQRGERNSFKFWWLANFAQHVGGKQLFNVMCCKPTVQV